MPEELDPFDAAAESAMTEDSGGGEAEAVEQAPVETDTPEATETAAEVTPEVEAPPAVEVAQPAPQAEEPWWQGRLNEEIEYKGVKMRLEDALAGGLRQADYTKKTQELAQRARIAEWGEETLRGLRDNPVEQIRKLAEDAGLIPKGQQQFDPQEDPDPAMVEIAEVKSQLDELRQARMVEEARHEIAAARAKYADFSDDVLELIVEYANEKGIGLTIEDGYWLLKAKQAANQEAGRAAATAAAQREAEAREAARAASAATTSGSSTATLTEDKDYGGLTGGELFEAIAWDVYGELDEDRP